MFTQVSDTNRAAFFDPRPVHELSRWTLRLDGGVLAIAGGFGLLTDITGLGS